ncbi:hypothetical protein RI578_18280 [Streptomyces sp. BB1-1-1]|uniref:hypothetical protein n=1 Tax=Streptomyces sp. BB1-1-1 TaxID=3074430 RepID=UPI002877F2B9|nr:hypothetical protein [Streptomyces sp. BB1-1-1]WND36113.1 hypothetical protein RI578_18280 [Streptomyces sp. BB1-1-1]
MTAWSWAEIGGDGGSTTADRQYADRRSRALAPRVGSDHSDHYAEKAAQRAAERREAEEYQRELEESREWEIVDKAYRRFQRDNPRPRVPANMDDPEFGARLAEDLNWSSSREDHALRAEGEELASRIPRR